MPIPAVQEVDIGTVVEVTFVDAAEVAIDISAATTMQIILKSITGTVITKTATFTTDGTDGKIQFTSLITDFPEAGRWKIQGRVILPTGTWRTAVGFYNIGENLS